MGTFDEMRELRAHRESDEQSGGKDVCSARDNSSHSEAIVGSIVGSAGPSDLSDALTN